MFNTLTTVVKSVTESGGLTETTVRQTEERSGTHNRGTFVVEATSINGKEAEQCVCPHHRRCMAKVPPHASQPQDVGETSMLETTASEERIFDELKRLRLSPRDYLTELEARRASIVGSTLWSGAVAVRLSEGTRVLDEAVAALREHCDKGAVCEEARMTHEEGLKFAARDLAFDVGPKGLINQRGTDESVVSDRVERYGSWSGRVNEIALFGVKGDNPVDVIVHILINDGVPSRFHRNILLNLDLTHVGVCVAPHATVSSCVVLVLATAFVAGSLQAMKLSHEHVGTRGLPNPTCTYCLGHVDLKRCIYGLRGRPYHRHCFLCNVCKSTLEGSFFERLDSQGNPDALCKSCMMFRSPSRCARCDALITSTSQLFSEDSNPLCKPCFTRDVKRLTEAFPSGYAL
jgi:hypothetical protein